MPEMVGFSQPQRHARPQLTPGNPRAKREAAPSDSQEAARRMYGDRMRIRKTQAMPQPKWGWLVATLLGIALALGIGVALGGGLVAVGIGLGWLSVALVALIWHDLGLAYQVFQAEK